MILKNVDTVLAFAAVMLILSLIVTTVVQMLVTLLSLRGQNLVRGVSRLFRQLDPAFTKAVADELSRKLLRHPAVVRSLGRVTQAISKEEFVKLANNMLQNSQVNLTDEAEKALRGYLAQTAAILPAGRQVVQAAAAGVTAAAGSVQKITKDVEDWFDTVLDRTRDVFAFHTRIITVAVALVLAIGGRVDTLHLFRQLSGNDDVRNRIVESVQTTTDEVSQILPQVQAGAQPQDLQSLDQQIKSLRTLTGDLGKTSLEIMASDWSKTTPAGMLMTAVFLGLGAPFWFNALKQLSGLRPAIAQVVDPKGSGGEKGA